MTHDDYEKVALVNERSNLDAVLYIEDGWKWIVMQTLAVKRFASTEGCPKNHWAIRWAVNPLPHAHFERMPQCPYFVPVRSFGGPRPYTKQTV